MHTFTGQFKTGHVIGKKRTSFLALPQGSSSTMRCRACSGSSITFVIVVFRFLIQTNPKASPII
jgi:hypothetical protein